jgi:hypothetical protein
VTWFNTVSSGQWATWPPGNVLGSGDIGTFDLERRFNSRETLAAYGIAVQVSAESPVPPRLYRSGGTMADYDVPGLQWSGLRFTANEPHACLLHILDATEKSVLNEQDVLDDVLTLLRRGRWSIDSQIVMRRIRARRGFAAISLEAGQSIELRTTGNPRAIIDAAEPGEAEWTLASSPASTGFQLYEFSDAATVVFGPPVRVRHSLWDRLLPWQAEDGHLTDPTGRRYAPGRLPQDLSHLTPGTRNYDPASSAMRPAELAAMTAAEVFEEVASLPESLADAVVLGSARQRATADSGWLTGIESFDLPRPPVGAAGRMDRLGVVLETASPDGLVGFALHERSRQEYWLEVSVAHPAQLPAVIALRYDTDGGGQQDLLIPVDDDGTGLPSSIVSVPGYAIGASWRAWPAVPRHSVGTWPDEVVALSVRAAVTVATAQAWKRLARAVRPDTAQVITRELDTIRESR